jgi:predicted RNase H-like nuclease (RuvC/YqgF family)
MARINSEDSTPSGKAARQSQKLTEERRARKRELDRQAQRCARMKTKNHIAQLEEQIESLKAINLSGSAKTLMVQLEEQKKQNEILRSKLNAIVKLAGGEIDGSCKSICIEGSVVAFTDTLKLRKLHQNRRGRRDSQHASQRVILIHLCLQLIRIQMKITMRIPLVWTPMQNSVQH